MRKNIKSNKFININYEVQIQVEKEMIRFIFLKKDVKITRKTAQPYSN